MYHMQSVRDDADLYVDNVVNQVPLIKGEDDSGSPSNDHQSFLSLVKNYTVTTSHCQPAINFSDLIYLYPYLNRCRFKCDSYLSCIKSF